MTDRGDGGFEFFAHPPCAATQGSIFSARSARRVQEKRTWSSSQISKRAKGSIFLARGLAWRRRVRNFRRAWRATENLEKYLAQQFDFQKRFSIQSGEYDRLEFYGTDQLERGPRFEAPFQKCVRLTRFKFCQSATDRHRGSEFWHGWPKGSTFSCLFPTRRRL